MQNHTDISIMHAEENCLHTFICHLNLTLTSCIEVQPPGTSKHS